MKALESGQRGPENYEADAQELPDEAAFVRKVLEGKDFRISVDCEKLKKHINENVSDPELRQKMIDLLTFIMMEMDPGSRPQALVQFFQTYYVQFSNDADLQRMIDFILDYEAMENFRLILVQLAAR